MKTSRRGITLIEVLSAIAVAAIGVFGVLILVPLASRMSQIGFSNEAARNNSTNVLAKANSYGALDYSRWTYYDATTATDVARYFQTGLRPTDAVCLDPLLLSQGGAFNMFPHTFASAGLSSTYTGNTVAMDKMTIARQRSVAPVRMGSGLAQQMVSEANSIRLAPAASDVTFPSQRFVDDPVSGRIKREVTSAKSSLLLMLPTTQGQSLVYRNMAVTIDGRQFINNAFDRVFNVSDQFTGSTSIRSDYGMIDLRFGEVDFDAAATERPDNLPSGGWVILVPYQVVGGVVTELWSQTQAFEVVTSDQRLDLDATGRTYDVTLVGPPFRAPDLVSGTPMLTQAIYIPGAIDVHEMEARIGVK